MLKKIYIHLHLKTCKKTCKNDRRWRTDTWSSVSILVTFSIIAAFEWYFLEFFTRKTAEFAPGLCTFNANSWKWGLNMAAIFPLSIVLVAFLEVRFHQVFIAFSRIFLTFLACFSCFHHAKRSLHAFLVDAKIPMLKRWGPSERQNVENEPLQTPMSSIPVAHRR